MEKKPQPNLEFYRILIPILAIFSGIIQLALLPIGLNQGIESSQYLKFFQGHLFVLLATVVISLMLFAKLVTLLGRCGIVHALAAVAALGVIAALGALPITSKDALIHHLAVPRWWIQAGFIVPIPWHEWSFYPMLLNLGYAGFLVVEAEWLTPFYHGCYLFILAGAVATFIYSRRDDLALASISYLVTLTIPILLRLASEPLVDLGLVLYATLAFTLFVYWTERNGWSLIERWYRVFVGIALGLALGTKYNGLLYLALFLPCAIIMCERTGIKLSTTLRAMVWICVVALAVFMPWMIKNFDWVGNPLHPLLGRFFVSTDLPLGAGGGGILSLERLRDLYGWEWHHIPLIPIMMLFIGKDGSPVFFDGVLSPILMLAIVPLLLNRKPPWVVPASILTITYPILMLFLAAPRVRYLAPILGVAIILAIYGLATLEHKFKSWPKVMRISVVLIHLAFVANYTVTIFREQRVASYLSGAISKETYLLEAIPEYSMIQYINSNLDADARIYLLYTGNRFYLYERHVETGGYASANKVLGWLRLTMNPNLLAKEFHGLGLTHLLFNAALTEKSFSGILTAEEADVWRRFTADRLEIIQTMPPFVLARVKN